MFKKRVNKSLKEIISEGYFQNKIHTFDNFMKKTHLRFWNPRDKLYIDLSQYFDSTKIPILPYEDFPELTGPLKTILDTEAKKIAYVNEYAFRLITGSLYAEQAAMLGAVTLSSLVDNPETIEYALNQAREEARHMIAFYDYISSRFGSPYKNPPQYQELLIKIIEAPKVHLQLVGVQIIIEGLGMGALAYFIRSSQDPVLRKLCSFVAADEATHHKFGLDWLKKDFTQLSKTERDEAEDWALYCFKGFEEAIFAIDELIVFYKNFGFSEEESKDIINKYHLNKPTNYGMIFNKLAHTLFKFGLITERTNKSYSFWLKRQAHSDDVFNKIIEDSTRIVTGINTQIKYRN